jgi:hypothetical protein
MSRTKTYDQVLKHNLLKAKNTRLVFFQFILLKMNLPTHLIFILSVFQTQSISPNYKEPCNQSLHHSQRSTFQSDLTTSGISLNWCIYQQGKILFQFQFENL